MRVSVERHVAIFDNPAERQAYVERWWPGAKPERINAFLDSGCVGTTEQVIDELRFFVARGAELIICWFQDLATTGDGNSMAERFIQRVAPALR